MSDDNDARPRFQARIPAGEGEVFAPGAFDRVVGQVAPLRLDEDRTEIALIVAAEVAPDGRSALVTYEQIG